MSACIKAQHCPGCVKHGIDSFTAVRHTNILRRASVDILALLRASKVLTLSCMPPVISPNMWRGA
eukprot:1206785-Pyramimonas_sp.AAC.1